uniref:Uncharacterized protein n=1 Tax=Arundo donax TaxID=35708 RepID=A0A0A9AE89_ARUDO
MLWRSGRRRIGRRNSGRRCLGRLLFLLACRVISDNELGCWVIW